MEKTIRMMALVVFMLLLANGAAMAVAPGPESDPNDVYWDDAFALRGVNGIINAIVRDAAGNVYVGGDFTRAGGVAANNIAKWDGKTWSALGTGFGNIVCALALDSSGNLYAGGVFTDAGGVAANRVAKWDGTSWSPIGSGMNDTVRALALDSSGNLYAGGIFTTAGGAPSGGLAKWNGSAWSDMGTGMPYIYALAVDSANTLYAGGYQTFSRRGVSETTWTSLTSSIGGSVKALALDGSGNVYAGGDFIGVNSMPINYLMKWDGTTISGLSAETTGSINALVFDSAGNLYAGGGFATAGGVTVNNVAIWNGTAWSALGTGADSTVNALALDGAGNLYAGGEFAIAGGTGAAGVAVWNGSAWNGLANAGHDNRVDNAVYATVADGLGNIYAGGVFTTAGGVLAPGVAKWDGATWSPLGTGINGYVDALALDNAGNLYAGGLFGNAGGVTANRIAKWDGTAWSPLGTGTNGRVYALALDSAGNLYAGGNFTAAGGVTVNYVAKWDGASWSPLGTGMYGGTVYALALDGTNNLYAGGEFTTAGGVTANRIAKWDGTAWSALGTGTNGRVYALALDGTNNLYVGGWFGTVGGVSALNVAKWDGTAWSALGSGLSDRVRGLSIVRNALFAGGIFDVAGGKGSHYFAVWQPRINHNEASLAASPGMLTLGDDDYGFYKPTLKTDATTTVSSAGGLPVTVTLDRANEIQVGGVRVNGACALSPAGVHFGGSGAMLTVEFSEDDVAAAGVPYTKFSAVQMTYPADYPTNKEAASATLMGSAVPALARIENGKKIYAITVPFTNTTANVAYGAAPVTLAAPATAPGPESDPNDVYWDNQFIYPGINGTVYAAVRDTAGNVYVGGDFTLASDVQAKYIAKWDGTKWSALGSGMSYSVWALALDSSGNLYAGGEFTKAGGLTTNRVAKWDGTSWSALGSGMENTVRALALDSSGNLYAGGIFTTAGGVPANAVAKWDGAEWSDMGNGTPYIYALAVDASDTLYAGGYHTFSRRRADETAWTPLAASIGGSVKALALDGLGNVYAGGDFIGVNSATINYLAKWDGTAISGLSAETTGSINALAMEASGTLYVGGAFVMAGAVTVNNVAIWNGTAWSALGTGVNNTVNALAFGDAGNLYAGGQFTTAGGVSANCMAHWNGTAWEGLANTGGFMSASVFASATDGFGNVYAGGNFATAGGVTVNRVAKWDGTAWSALGTGVDNTVNALATDGSGNLYAGGNFTTAGGVTANRVAKWDGTAWSALGTGTNSAVSALAADGSGNLYVGGNFTTAGGVTVNNIAKWDGTAWFALGTGTNSTVSALAADGSGNLYVGGNFTTADGIAANYVAKWDGTAWSALGTGTNSTVVALAVDGSGNLYAAGNFTAAGGVSVNNIAKWDGTAWSALGTGMNDIVFSLACDGSGNLYGGGFFTTAGGVTANRVAKWDGTAWSALGSGLAYYTPGALVRCILIDRNTLFAGGIFSTAGGRPSYDFAQWQPRVNQSETSVSASPGSVTLGNDINGFYKPALKTDGDTTVSYTGSLPVTMTLGRANEIQLGGIRVNGAFTLGPEGIQFGGSGATLRIEFSEDDAAAFGAPYTDFRAVILTYPANYPTSKNAATVTELSSNTAAPIRLENRKQIYAITVPFAASGGTYAAVPLTLYTPPAAPSNPGATAIGFDTITWTWTDTSSNETGFNVYDDPGAEPPNTLQFTVGMGVQLWQHNGLSANTQYAFQASAVNAYSESARLDTLTAWTLIEPVTDLWFSNSTATELAVMAYDTPGNLSGGASGLLFNNTTAGTDSGWQQNNDGWTSSGLTPNTLYTFTGRSRNGAAVETTAVTATRYTLGAPPSVGDNVVCDHAINTPYPVAAVFTFTNPAGFGEGMHGGSAYRTSSFRYAWDMSDTYFFSDGDPAWNDGTLEQYPMESGTYYLHLQSINADGMPGETLDYGPFVVDGEAPQAVFSLDDPTPTGLDAVTFSVDFNESVGASFGPEDVTVMGMAPADVLVTGTDPNYTVTVTLADPVANGAVWIVVGTEVTDLAGNPYEGGFSPQYAIDNFPGFILEPSDTRKYTGDAFTFEVAIGAGSGVTSYLWKWEDGTKALHDGPAAPEWPLTGLTAANRGEYWCEVTYNGEVYPTAHATLSVEDHMEVTVLPSTGEASVGGAHTFTVEVEDGYYPYTYTWDKDGEVIDGAVDDSYTRSNLQESDSGTYRVTVMDDNGDLRSATAELTVALGAPAIGLLGVGALIALVALAGAGKTKKR